MSTDNQPLPYTDEMNREYEEYERKHADKFSITILWGETPEPDAEPITYEFDTQKEINAFIHGFNESDGWWGFEEIDTTTKEDK